MDIARKNALRVVALLDGRPGHEKQTKGIIQALQTVVEVETREIVLGPATPFTIVRQLVKLFLSGKGHTHPRIAGADLLVGTGSRTHLPLLLFKKQYGGRAVTCMSPPRFLRNYFDLCFVPEHDGLREGNNIMHTIGAPNCSRNKSGHQKDCGLIVLGGVDPKSHRWQSTTIAEMVRKIVSKEPWKKWTLSSSPRTPQETSRLLTTIAHEFHNVAFFDYKDTEPGWIERQYDKNRFVWVTADSISMIYEALTAGCKVGILPIHWIRTKSKFKLNEELLLHKQLVVPFSSWFHGEAAWPEDFKLNEAQRCAERIVQKWWPIN